MTDPQPQILSGAPPSPTTVAEVTGLVGLFAGMLDRALDKTETRILDKLAENARAATDRWSKHDEDSKRTLAGIDERFVRVETPLATHLDEERTEDLVLRARIKPVQSAAGWVAHHWKDIALVIVAVLTALGLAGGNL